MTGDTLFIGDVGRPDLSPDHTPQQLAGMLYDSLHQKLLRLPDSVEVYPAHGAGSLCGRNISQERSSTIGKRTQNQLRLEAHEPRRIRPVADIGTSPPPRIFPARRRNQSRWRVSNRKPRSAEGTDAARSSANPGERRGRARYASGHSIRSGTHSRRHPHRAHRPICIMGRHRNRTRPTHRDRCRRTATGGGIAHPAIARGY